MAKEKLVTKIESSKIWTWVGIGSLVIAGGLILVAWNENQKAKKAEKMADTEIKDAAEAEAEAEVAEEPASSAGGGRRNIWRKDRLDRRN